MSAPFIFTSGIVAIALLVTGLLITFREFKEMNKHPENFRRDRSDEPKIVEKKRPD